MALAPTVLTASYSISNLAAYTTASIAPVADRPIFVEIASVGANAVTGVTGCGLTWEQVNITNQGNSIRLAVYRSAGAAPTAGALTLTHAGTQTSCTWTVTQWAGAEQSGSNGSGAVVQSVVTAATGTQSSITTTLAALASSDNVHLCSIARNRSDAITEDADFAANSNQSGLGESIDTSSQWAADEVANTSTFASASHATCSISIEIRAFVEDAAGTTADAIQEGQGIRLGFVLAIEGYPYLITDAGDVTSVLTAWTNTGWTQALPGLEIRGQVRQSIEPWADSIDAPRLTFAVMPDPTDQFGIDVWKTKPSFATYLSDVFQPDADGTGTLTCYQTTAAGASGTVFVGTKRIAYGAKGATTFTVTNANDYSPYEGNAAAIYATGHPLPDLGPSARVQDVTKTWIGKKVALYIHRIRGTRWDTKSGAQLEFAGRIREVSEDERGFTIMECEDLRADIRDAVLHFNQWKGTVREGIKLIAGMKVRAGVVTASTGQASYTTNTFTVVTGSPAGAYEIQVGYYKIHEFVSKLDGWLNSEGLGGADWLCSIVQDEGGGWRTLVQADLTTTYSQIMFEANDLLMFEFLGWPPGSSKPTDNNFNGVSTRSKDSNNVYRILSPAAPLRARALQQATPFAFQQRFPPAFGTDAGGYDVEIATDPTTSQPLFEGDWFGHQEWLPQPFRSFTNGGQNYSFLRVGKAIAWGRYESATSLKNVGTIPLFTGFTPSVGYLTDLYGAQISVDDAADTLTISQIVVLGDSLTALLPRLLASINGAGTNHEDYDVFPFGAAIPWSLLGDDFLASLESLEQVTASGGMTVVLEKPTKLVDILMPELALRFAWIIFKDGVYQVTSPPTPSSATADHALTEANKADRAGSPQRARSEVMDQYLRNVIKVEFNRVLTSGGEYRDSVTVKDETSAADYGESQAVTIRAYNSYAEANGSDAAIRALIVSLTSRVLPALAKPTKVITRSIAPLLYHACPGDTVTVSDDFVRDPGTGQRGLSSRAGIILSTAHDWGKAGGELFGEVQILISDEDRTFPLSPCAQVDHTHTTGLFTAGYDGTNGIFKLVAKQHQRSLSILDDVSFFAAADKVRIIQIDPADPTAPLAWDRTISSVDTANNKITLTATLSSPSFDTAMRYRIVPQRFADAVAAQQTKSFIADDGDRLIQDAAQPNLYGENNQQAYTRNTYSTLPSLIPTEAYTEGRPVHPGLVADLGNMLNNLVSHKCAPCAPMLWDTVVTTTESTSYELTLLFPFFVGSWQQEGTVRYLKVAPRTTISAAGGTTSVRVTSCATPPSGTSLTGHSWTSPKNQAVFTNNADPDAAGIESTVQDLLPVVAPNGITFITVELKVTATYTAHFFGLSTFYLGPVEAA